MRSRALTTAAITVLSLALPGAQISAQEAEPAPEIDPVEAAKETPIIVSGTRAEDETGESTGSRIAKKPRFTNQNIRSATGIAGLTPGSGMTPLAGENATVRKRITKCVSDNDALSQRATCILANAAQDRANGAMGLAADAYRYVASSDEFSGEDRLAGGQLLYALGEETSKDGLREEALIRMLESDVLEGSSASSARRTLVSMALKRQDNALAIERLEDVVSADPKDAQSLANLAILLRKEEREGAQARMAEAISAREAESQEVPGDWLAF